MVYNNVLAIYNRVNYLELYYSLQIVNYVVQLSC